MAYIHTKNYVYEREKFQSTLGKWKQIVTLIYTRSWKHAIYFMSQVLLYGRATNNTEESGKYTRSVLNENAKKSTSPLTLLFSILLWQNNVHNEDIYCYASNLLYIQHSASVSKTQDKNRLFRCLLPSILKDQWYAVSKILLNNQY